MVFPETYLLIGFQQALEIGDTEDYGEGSFDIFTEGVAKDVEGAGGSRPTALSDHTDDLIAGHEHITQRKFRKKSMEVLF